MRNRTSKEVWEQIKAGYAAGIGLREIGNEKRIAVTTVKTPPY